MKISKSAIKSLQIIVNIIKLKKKTFKHKHNNFRGLSFYNKIGFKKPYL